MTTKAAIKPRSTTVHERIVNNDPRTFGDHDFDIGTVSHQGDLILVRIAKLPKSVKPRASRQLAEGNTQGSRHILIGGEAFDCVASKITKEISKVCKGVSVDARYVGPVFTTPATIEHPEHGHQTFNFTGVVACVYQRNMDQLQRERRVLD